MGGGLMQLVAYGAQDIYLTANPQVTFFKVVYRRHTNFAMEAIEQVFNGSATWGKRVTATISRNGDLIHRVYLQVTLPRVECGGSTSNCFRWVNYVGHALIKSVEVEIGGQRIDKHYGDWLNIWNELTQEPGHQVGYDNMVGNTAALTGSGLNVTEATTLYVPLQFWFCRNPGLALPLIALQYHEVKIIIEFRQKHDCYVAAGDGCEATCGSTCGGLAPTCGPTYDSEVCVGDFQSATLFVDYIYLDTDERRRFAQVSHEYLIEQLQFTGDESITNTTAKINLNFNHPTKEIIWVTQRDAVTQRNANQWTNYTDDYDVDGAWGNGADGWGNGCLEKTGNPTVRQMLNTNVEAGYHSSSFPYVKVPGNILGNDSRTTSEIEALLSTGVNFPSDFSSGPCDCEAPCSNINSCANNVPTNFSDRTDASRGSDHAGLGPRNAGRNPTVRAKLQLNGHDRFQERLGSYFNLVQPYQHHTNVPATGINVYSFALKPEEHQPSGTCNFSRIDKACLQIQFTNKAALGSKTRVYAVNYNVLRIMSGIIMQYILINCLSINCLSNVLISCTKELICY